jgi:hypothetical protein
MGASRLFRLVAGLGLAAGLVSAGVGLAGPASAELPANPPPCTWTFGALSTSGALGTLGIEVTLVPSSPSMSCLQTVRMAAKITNSAGGVPAGISSDGGPTDVSLLFSRGELPPPTVLVAWHAYCTDVAQPVFLHLRGAGMVAVYPLGLSRPCSQGPGPSSAVDPPRVFVPNPAIGLAPSAGGYRIATVDSSVLQQPGAVVEGGISAPAPFVGMASASNGGFWLVSSAGGVYAFNGAPFYGSAGNLQLSAPIVGMAATPTGHGYWLLGSDGGVFSYGDAAFHGSTGNLRLNAPVVGMASSKDGGGYWLAASDGGVFSYDAPFHGSAGNLHVASPVTGITASPDSGGYWLLGGDGGVFTYGDATFHGTGTELVFP